VAAIELRSVEKRYGDNVVVERLDLTIADGEFIVLVGPSGCGKSTTLRMIAGLESISSGDLLIDGKRVNDVAPGDRDLAMVFQSYALYPHMSVRQNIGFGLQVRKMADSEIKRRVDDVAAMLGLETLLDRKPAQLSGGQRQRVAMGRAIVRSPKAFLFDEPLSNLDAKLRTEVRAEIARIRRKLGTTTVYVTHDQVEAMTLADRVVVLHGGRAQQIGPPMEVYRKPANRFVAAFLGTPTMVFFDGTPTTDGFLPEGTNTPIALAGISPETRTIAVRPHDIRAAGGAEKPPVNAVSLGAIDVDIVERLGAETFIFGALGQARVAALVADDRDLHAGENVALTVERTRILAFDAAGARLSS
jgi:ABC-type sugar transport system ATPase subunit